MLALLCTGSLDSPYGKTHLPISMSGYWVMRRFISNVFSGGMPSPVEFRTLRVPDTSPMSCRDGCCRKGSLRNSTGICIYLTVAHSLELLHLPYLCISFRISLRAVQRELTIRFSIIEHDARLHRPVFEVFGSNQALREAQNEKIILYNAFAAFLHHIRRCGPDGVKIRNLLIDEAKMQWRILAKKKMNEKCSDALKATALSFGQ